MAISREYELFQSNYAALSSGMAQAVVAIANKALEKRLIGPETLAKAMNTEKTAEERASGLAYVLLSRVQVRSSDFYVILDILKDIPTLSHLVQLLEPGYAPEQTSQASGQAAALHASGQAVSQASGQTAASQASGQALLQTSGQAIAPSPKLKERPSNRDAFVALLPVASDWRAIGTCLYLPAGQLESIQNNSTKDRNRLLELIAEWLKTLDANWGKLIAAVKLVDEQRASEIEKAFL